MEGCSGTNFSTVVAQRLPQKDPGGAQEFQDLMLMIWDPFVAFLKHFGYQHREKCTSNNHSNKYHKKVAWRGHLSLQLESPRHREIDLGTVAGRPKAIGYIPMGSQS